MGFLSSSAAELAEAVRGAARFDPRRCHEHAIRNFGLPAMADGYLARYERVVAGEPLHPAPPRRTVPAPPGLLPFD